MKSAKHVKIGRYRFILRTGTGGRMFYFFQSPVTGGTWFADFWRFRLWRDGANNVFVKE